MTTTNNASPDAKRPAPDEIHTGQGAPTDRAHEGAGDGTLTGSTPAGLTTRELEDEAKSDRVNNAAATS
jgi:hypothetical protein